jgi:signal transduction histidine kinase
VLVRVALLPLLLFAPLTFALDPHRSVSQYDHTMWTVQDGALCGSPTVLAQTTDGYLVIASNNDGGWNESGASPDFSITPTFYQTRWFGALCIAAVTSVLWLLYLTRVRQIEMRIRMRLEERLIERERIARDLHDTLLQSVQGLVLRFQAVLARIPEGGERPVQMMEQALERADQVLAEGRDQVFGFAQVNTGEQRSATGAAGACGGSRAD